jgi:pyruvate/2-oxoglutarate dehydrogenase complex dihydrolipoamide acyltransferase (E2) component
MTTLTTHLICVPELEQIASVSHIYVAPGQEVGLNAPLLCLQYAEELIEICAPDAGLVSHLMVTLAETVATGDLLLQMEIEEAPVQIFATEELAFASACLQDWPQDQLISASPAAATLAARLGVDLSTVQAQGASIETHDVEAHVRTIMLQWLNAR